MKKSTKIILAVSGALMALGLVIGGVGYALGGGNIGVYYDNEGWHTAAEAGRALGASAAGYVGDSFETPGVTTLDIDCDMGRVELRPGDVTAVTVEYRLPAEQRVTWTADGGTLTFHARYPKGVNFGMGHFLPRLNFFWFNPIEGIDFRRPEESHVIVTYPKNATFASAKVDASMGEVVVNGLTASGKLEINADLGSLQMDGVTAGDIQLNLAMGNAILKDLTAGSLACSDAMGDLEFRRLDVKRFHAETSMGQIDIDDSYLGEAKLNSDLGTVVARNIETTSLDAECSSGDLEIDGALRGRTILNGDLGTITVRLTLPQSDYDYSVDIDLGSFHINDKKSKNYERSEGSPHQLEVNNSSGDVDFYFD